MQYRPDYPRRPFINVEEACAWVVAFVDWYNHQHRHSGEAVAISRHRARVYEQARQMHQRRWSRSARCWIQPEVAWINPPPSENDITPATLVVVS